MQKSIQGLKIKLTVPKELKNMSPKVHGEWLGHDGQIGTIVSAAGNGGVWVHFGNPHEYYGWPVKHCELVDANNH